jgi:restriction endonuclease Mrr
MEKIPNPSELMVPLLTVIKEHGGKLNHRDIEIYVAKMLNISDVLRNQIRSGRRTELNYRLSWSRTKAKSLGYLEKMDGGNWSLTKNGENFISK